LSGFDNKTHTPKFFIRPTSNKKKVEEREREETPAEKRKVGAFLGRRGKPLDARRSTLEERKKRNGETKKKCMSLRVSQKEETNV